MFKILESASTTFNSQSAKSLILQQWLHVSQFYFFIQLQIVLQLQQDLFYLIGVFNPSNTYCKKLSKSVTCVYIYSSYIAF